MSNAISHRQCCLLFALRSKTVRGIKINFRHMYSSEVTLCPICEKCVDTQEHVLQCEVLLNIEPNREHIEFDHIDGNMKNI